MTRNEAYGIGKRNGYGIARSNRAELTDDVEKFIDLCLETESQHFRQFSPFEFTAQAFNDSDDSEGLWEAYDKGVYDGIAEVVKNAN